MGCLFSKNGQVRILSDDVEEPLPASAFSSRGAAHAWLQEIGLPQYAAPFEDAGFSDWDLLSCLNAADLDAITTHTGAIIPPGHRKKLLMASRQMGQSAQQALSLTPALGSARRYSHGSYHSGAGHGSRAGGLGASAAGALERRSTGRRPSGSTSQRHPSGSQPGLPPPGTAGPGGNSLHAHVHAHTAGGGPLQQPRAATEEGMASGRRSRPHLAAAAGALAASRNSSRSSLTPLLWGGGGVNGAVLMSGHAIGYIASPSATAGGSAHGSGGGAGGAGGEGWTREEGYQGLYQAVDRPGSRSGGLGTAAAVAVAAAAAAAASSPGGQPRQRRRWSVSKQAGRGVLLGGGGANAAPNGGATVASVAAVAATGGSESSRGWTDNGEAVAPGALAGSSAGGRGQADSSEEVRHSSRTSSFATTSTPAHAFSRDLDQLVMGANDWGQQSRKRAGSRGQGLAAARPEKPYSGCYVPVSPPRNNGNATAAAVGTASTMYDSVPQSNAAAVPSSPSSQQQQQQLLPLPAAVTASTGSPVATVKPHPPMSAGGLGSNNSRDAQLFVRHTQLVLEPSTTDPTPRGAVVMQSASPVNNNNNNNPVAVPSNHRAVGASPSGPATTTSASASASHAVAADGADSTLKSWAQALVPHSPKPGLYSQLSGGLAAAAAKQPRSRTTGGGEPSSPPRPPLTSGGASRPASPGLAWGGLFGGGAAQTAEKTSSPGNHSNGGGGGGVRASGGALPRFVRAIAGWAMPAAAAPATAPVAASAAAAGGSGMGARRQSADLSGRRSDAKPVRTPASPPLEVRGSRVAAASTAGGGGAAVRAVSGGGGSLGVRDTSNRGGGGSTVAAAAAVAAAIAKEPSGKSGVAGLQGARSGRYMLVPDTSANHGPWDQNYALCIQGRAYKPMEGATAEAGGASVAAAAPAGGSDGGGGGSEGASPGSRPATAMAAAAAAARGGGWPFVMPQLPQPPRTSYSGMPAATTSAAASNSYPAAGGAFAGPAAAATAAVLAASPSYRLTPLQESSQQLGLNNPSGGGGGGGPSVSTSLLLESVRLSSQFYREGAEAVVVRRPAVADVPMAADALPQADSYPSTAAAAAAAAVVRSSSHKQSGSASYSTLGMPSPRQSPCSAPVASEGTNNGNNGSGGGGIAAAAAAAQWPAQPLRPPTRARPMSPGAGPTTPTSPAMPPTAAPAAAAATVAAAASPYRVGPHAAMQRLDSVDGKPTAAAVNAAAGGGNHRFDAPAAAATAPGTPPSGAPRPTPGRQLDLQMLAEQVSRIMARLSDITQDGKEAAACEAREAQGQQGGCGGVAAMAAADGVAPAAALVMPPQATDGNLEHVPAGYGSSGGGESLRKCSRMQAMDVKRQELQRLHADLVARVSALAPATTAPPTSPARSAAPSPPCTSPATAAKAPVAAAAPTAAAAVPAAVTAAAAEALADVEARIRSKLAELADLTLDKLEEELDGGEEQPQQQQQQHVGQGLNGGGVGGVAEREGTTAAGPQRKRSLTSPERALRGGDVGAVCQTPAAAEVSVRQRQRRDDEAALREEVLAVLGARKRQMRCVGGGGGGAARR
ncbi:hypothetical protein Agub_g11745, partial [Astrephomene gubernaculifera]